MKNTILVFAMQEELDAFLSVLHQQVKTENGIHSFALTPSHQVYLLVTGITMLNCYRLTPWLTSLQPTMVIQVGTCAGLKQQPIGAVLHARTFYNADLNLTMFDRPPGRLTRDEKIETIPDVLVSGSAFLDNQETKTALVQKFRADGFDMEAFGFYTMCQGHRIPFMSIRGVSDNGETHAGLSFEQNLVLAAQAAARATLTYLQAS